MSPRSRIEVAPEELEALGLEIGGRPREKETNLRSWGYVLAAVRTAARHSLICGVPSNIRASGDAGHYTGGPRGYSYRRIARCVRALEEAGIAARVKGFVNMVTGEGKRTRLDLNEVWANRIAMTLRGASSVVSASPGKLNGDREKGIKPRDLDVDDHPSLATVQAYNDFMEQVDVDIFIDFATEGARFFIEKPRYPHEQFAGFADELRKLGMTRDGAIGAAQAIGMTVVGSPRFADRIWPLEQVVVGPTSIRISCAGLCHIRRIWSWGSFQLGGRFYGPMQSIPSPVRRYIRFNGERVAEPDFSAYHIRMLADFMDIQLPADPYAIRIPGLNDKTSRFIGKVYINRAIACRDADQTANAVRSELRAQAIKLPGGITMAEVRALVEQRLDKAAWLLFIDDALNLQAEDSAVMLKIIATTLEARIPMIPVHDSVVTPVSYRSRTVEIMKASYRDKYWVDPVVN